MLIYPVVNATYGFSCSRYVLRFAPGCSSIEREFDRQSEGKGLEPGDFKP